MNADEESIRSFLRGYRDGSLDERYSYDLFFRGGSCSKVLICGLAFLLRRLGYGYIVDPRSDKEHWRITITTNHRSSPDVVRSVREVRPSCSSVFDLETESHAFHAGIGNIIVHNTDSVFVRIDGDLNNALMQGEMLANRITSELRTSFSGAEIVIEFEKVYSKILFGKVKKRYAGIKVWDGGQPTNKLDVTGFEVKRSDSSLLSIDIQKKVMNILLSEDDPEQSLKSLLRGLKSSFEDVPLTMMAMPKGVKKSLDSYGGVNAKGGKIGIPAVVRAAMYSNKHFGTSFGAGSKPKMIYIKDVPDGYEETDVIAFDDDTVIPPGFIPDYEKMWNTIVKRKVQPLVEIIGLDFDELVDTHRQSRLDEFQEAK